MKKLINRPESVVEEMLEGLVAVYPGSARLPGQSVVVRADAEVGRDRQVALISGGGSGHEPAHAGYVGRGMLVARRSRGTCSPRRAPTPCSPRSGPSPGPPGRS